MLAYASYHSMGSSIKRKSPLIRFPCCEIVPSASNRLITVAVSISTTSLSLIICFDKATTLPPRQGRFCKSYLCLSLCRYQSSWSAVSITDLHRVIWWLRDHAGVLLFRSSRIYSGVRYDVL